ncbi:MAG TPA: hypothetical protein VF395_11440 [Polyangiaceae bacterium]
MGLDAGLPFEVDGPVKRRGHNHRLANTPGYAAVDWRWFNAVLWICQGAVAMSVHCRATARSFAAIAIGACMFVGCARPVAPQATAPAPSPERKLLDGRQALLDALGAQQVFTAPRMVVHVAHVCNLVIAGAVYPVVDLQELVKGAMVPRGVNAILVLDSALRLLRRIEYTTERPLFCRNDRLYVWGSLTIDGVHREGNEITFGSQAEVTELVRVEANDVPAPTFGVEPPR